MKRSSKPRRRRRILIASTAVLVVGIGGYALAHSSLFGVTGIEVRGTSRTSEVVTASDVHLGENVLGLDLRAIDTRVQTLPWVETSHAVRSGTLGLRIDVVERHAVLVLRDGLNQIFVDQDGVRAEQTTPATRLPVVDVKSSTRVGGSRDPAELARAAIAFWRALPKDVLGRIDSIIIGASNAITFTIDNTRVNFGGSDLVAEKLRALTLVRERVARAGRTLIAIDVRAPSHPAARIR